jgi:4-amino-4-deoxy-L-arabinose transferase-like glycosyltransferase
MARPLDRIPPESRRFWIGLGVITLIALAWRVYYVIDQHVFCGSGSRDAFLRSPSCHEGRLLLNGDAAYYHWEANLVAKGYGFIDPTRFELFGTKTPSAGHPPAYMIYLAGVSRFIGTSELTHRLASTVLGAAAVFMIGVLARHIFKSDWAGWTAALLAAGYANLWINDEMLMSESMYVLATAVAVLLAYRFWDAPRVRTAVLMGLGIAFATLSRAEAISLFPFLAVPFGFLVTRRGGGKVRWKRGAKFALASCLAGGLLIVPWVAYNSTRFEHPVFLSNGAGSVLMTANCDSWVPRDEPQDAGQYRGTYHGNYVGYWSIYCTGGLDARLEHFYPPAKAAYYQEQLGNIPGTDINFFGDESTHEVAWRAVGTAEIKDHLRQMPWVIVLRVGRMWDFFRPRQNMFLNGVLEGRGYWQSRLATFEYYPLLALSIGGLVLLRRRRVPILPFLAIALTITITAATSFGITRYRAPVDAMLPVLAGGALVWLFQLVWNRWKQRGRAPQPAPAAP